MKNAVLKSAILGSIVTFSVGELAEKIAEICQATGNPEYAVELLLGVTETLPQVVLAQRTPTKVDELHLVSVDHWKNVVKYEYKDDNTEYVYPLLDVDPTTVNAENYKELTGRWYSGAKGITVNLGGYRQRESSCTVEEWRAYELPTPKHLQEEISCVGEGH